MGKAENRKFETLSNARTLRKSQTDAEKILWTYLRNRLFRGLKFRRQYPIGIYITDFFCPEKNLIVEVDGKIHEQKERILWDKDREDNLKAQNYNIIRFNNIEILNNINSVLEKLSEHIDKIEFSS